MKITIKEPPAGTEEEIIVLCHNISPELLRVLNSIKTPNNMLVANIDNEIHRVNPLDVFYIESVDRKTFLYCESNVYESKQKLYELEERAMKDFLRISKSIIVNVNKIKTLIPSLSGNGEAVLTNNERLVISRRYVNDLREILGM
ncbi:MAG: LytTR family transcriptional regulator [Defluviitaleaceae bacterium]|nr:LytTR family transcriptional regulator [Defluviitaleaceae bacterium]MCL2224922.1 LytTR family transcriptional regulator [Defluviitaleaceae bacterium]MCL2262516.1 LytTR family transcriptional regulator [Defluviitaleaceae bacterium]